jgi:hypothetical protein
MADLKISQLTSATLPLAGTEVLPIVQSSSTKKVATDDLTVKNVRSNATTGILQVAGPATAVTRIMTVPDANFTAARIDAAQSFTGDQTLGTGNLIQGTAGKGVNFTANTNAPGMTSELLNWYEEGTWTPTVRGSGTAGTYQLDANTTCRYTRIGRQVTLTVRIRMAAAVTGGGTGDLYITGVPFAKSANQIAVGSVYLAVGTFTGNLPTVIFDSLEGTSSTLYFPQNASGGFGTSLPISFASANAYIGFTLTYTV